MGGINCYALVLLFYPLIIFIYHSLYINLTSIIFVVKEVRSQWALKADGVSCVYLFLNLSLFLTANKEFTIFQKEEKKEYGVK